MSENTHGLRVLITGAGRGLGRALALELARQGARLVLVARTRTELDDTVAAARALGADAHGVVGDVGEKSMAHPIAAQAMAALGGVDVVVHNASTLGQVPMAPLLDTECEALESALAVNVVGPFRLTKLLAGPMALRGRGTVVMISSDAAVSAYPTWGAYGASKAALDHLARIWAAELEGTGVRVWSIDPGEMNTRMHADAMPDADPATLADPAVVARALAALVTHPERLPNGARLSGDELARGEWS